MPGSAEAGLFCSLCQIGLRCSLSNTLAGPLCQVLGHGRPLWHMTSLLTFSPDGNIALGSYLPPPPFCHRFFVNSVWI